MYPSRRFSATLMLLAAAACGPASDQTAEPAAPAPDPAAVRSAIEAVEKQWSAAYAAADADGIAALYTEDAASIPASGDWIRGRDGIRADMQAAFDTVNVTAREDIPEEITVMGDYAVEVGHYSWAGTSKKTGAAVGGSGRYVVLWRKDADGSWRLHRDMGAEAQ